MISAVDLNLIYTSGGQDTYAVKDIDLSIRAGEYVGLMGPSGSGKSSLLYLLAGLKRATRGHVYYQDMNLTDMTNTRLADLRRQQFGFIFQQHFLIGYLTVLENVLVACKNPKAEKERAVAVLSRMGLDKHIRKLPHQLSGGQRQRIAAARAIVARPEVIFADEPTASLDSRTGQELMAELRAYRDAGGTLVVVTHDPSMLSGADRVIKMRDGTILGELNGDAALAQSSD